MRLSLKTKHPLIWGHRGCRSLAPENTLAALDVARGVGADGCEVDVVLTRDGVPVLLHDLNLLRTTDAARHATFRDNPPALPWRFTLEELRVLDAGGEASCGRQPIPTLAQALGRAAELGLWLNIEIKDVSTAMPGPLGAEIVRRTLAVVVEAAMDQAVIISSFNHAYVAECKQRMPHVLTAALTPHGFDGDAVALARSLGADAWHPGHKGLTRQAVVAARQAGIAVTPYTVNEPVRMAQLFRWGVNGIVTDCPQDAPRA